MGMFDDLVPSQAGAQPAKAAGMFGDLIPAAQEGSAPRFGRQAYDVGRGLEAGADRGVAGLLGFPADLAGLAVKGKDFADAYLSGRSYDELKTERDAKATIKPEALESYGSQAFMKAAETLSGPEYKPQTTAGEYARTVGEFLPNAVGGAATLPARLARVAVPAVASETAGQVTKGTAAEPYARFGGALAGAGAAGLAGRANTAEAAIGRAAGDLAPAERQAAMTRFDGLMADAQTNGIPLSPAFAWDAATNGASDMASLFRHAEAMGRMRGFNAQMPDAVKQAGRAQFDTLAPLDTTPTLLGERVGQTAQAALDSSPLGRNVAEAVQQVGPRITPDQAGQVIQRELRGVRDAREGARDTQAATDYAAARAAPENVGIERMITVERPGEPVVTPQSWSRPQFAGSAPRPIVPPPLAESAAAAGPESLGRFIARQGGIALDGEATATDLHRFNIPGLGNVARQNGRSIDNHWREALIEAGYLKPDADGGAARDITSELLRKLQNEQRGVPSYPIGAERQAQSARSSGAQVGDEYRHAVAQAQDRLHTDLRQAGVDPASVHPDIQSRTIGALLRGEASDPLDAYERVVGAMEQNPSPLVRSTTIQEQVPDVRFGQVNAQPALDALSRQSQFAKGDVRGALGSARGDLLENRIDPRTGVRESDMSVEGLLKARERLDFQIQSANDVGDATKVRDLQIVRSSLDRQLKQVPEVATADTNFATNSRPLEPFGGNTPLGRVTARDDLSGRMQTPTEQVPGMLSGASATRETVANATPAAREAMQGRITTQIMDQARDFSGRVSVERLRAAMRENEDVLGQFPEALERLNRVARAQEGLDGLNGTLIGRLAERNPTTAKAVSIMFPKGGELLANGEREIGAAIGALARENPTVARQLVRAKAENVFNATTKDLQGGPNQMGGAKFRTQLVGDPQEAANLVAAVRALPNGDTIADGFGRFLDVLNATGRRQNVGSRTAYNEEFLREAREGGAVEGSARLAAGGFVKFPGKIQERLERWRLGRNVDELARLFSDPDAVGAFRGLVAAGERNTSIAGPVGRLVAIASRSSAQPRENAR